METIKIGTTDILLASNDVLVGWKHSKKEIWTYKNDTTKVSAYISKGPTDSEYSVIVADKVSEISNSCAFLLNSDASTLDEARSMCISFLQ